MSTDTITTKVTDEVQPELTRLNVIFHGGKPEGMIRNAWTAVRNFQRQLAFEGAIATDVDVLRKITDALASKSGMEPEYSGGRSVQSVMFETEYPLLEAASRARAELPLGLKDELKVVADAAQGESYADLRQHQTAHIFRAYG